MAIGRSRSCDELRAVVGDFALGARAEAIARAALLRAHNGAKILADVGDMRLRMERERPAKSDWDLKLSPGGFVDIEFTKDLQGIDRVITARS